MTSIYSAVGFQPRNRYAVVCSNLIRELDEVAEELKQFGLPVLKVRSSMSWEEQQAVLAQFVQGTILVAQNYFFSAGGFCLPNIHDVQDIIIMENRLRRTLDKSAVAQLVWRFRPKPATIVVLQRMSSMDLMRGLRGAEIESRQGAHANPCGEVFLQNIPPKEP